MGKFVDSIITFRILNMLVTPFENTLAYRLGIIDAKGKELKHMRDLNTVEERDAYTLLHRLVFRLKRIINKVPIENKKLVSLAAAYSLVREELQNGKESMNLEEKFLKRLDEDLTKELQEVNEAMDKNKIFTFKQFNEEEGAGPAVAANNAMATAGVAGLDKDPPVSKKAQKKWTAANTMFKRGKPNV
jgi:hypothetical protein